MLTREPLDQVVRKLYNKGQASGTYYEQHVFSVIHQDVCEGLTQ